MQNSEITYLNPTNWRMHQLRHSICKEFLPVQNSNLVAAKLADEQLYSASVGNMMIASFSEIYIWIFPSWSIPIPLLIHDDTLKNY